MRKVAALLLAFLPVGVASAAGPPPLVLFSGQIGGAGPDVVVQHVDGTGRVSLTGGAGSAVAPAWSPDGSIVAFASSLASRGTGEVEVYVVAADGTGLRAVTHDAPIGHSRFSPTWSPDGTQLAYLEKTPSTGSTSSDVWTISAAGGSPRRLTTDGGDKQGVAWQPHGSLLLFERPEATSVWGLWTIDVRSGAEHRIADVLPYQGGVSTYWSPDGTRLAFPDRQSHVAVAAADGSGLHELNSLSSRGTPAWSPDGTALAYAAAYVLTGKLDRFGPPTAIDVVEVDASSGAARRLTGPFDGGIPGSNSGLPSWWPDGSRLFFRADGTDPTGSIQMMNADGTCEVPTPFSIAAAVPLVFQPGVPLQAGPVRCVDLRVRATVLESAVAPRQEAHVRVVVENDGNEPATGVTVRISPLVTAVAPLARADIGMLAPGDERSVTVTLASANVGLASGVVTAVGAEPDPTPANARTTIAMSVLNCTLVGTWGADTLDGTPGRDRICGLPGADRIDGGKGADYLDAGNGNDTIVGGPGRDTVIARGGRDVIYARDGALDWIDCGTEYDIAIVDRIDHTHHCEKVVRR
jgi:Tol biopolymer transport system component